MKLCFSQFCAHNPSSNKSLLGAGLFETYVIYILCSLCSSDPEEAPAASAVDFFCGLLSQVK